MTTDPSHPTGERALLEALERIRNIAHDQRDWGIRTIAENAIEAAPRSRPTAEAPHLICGRATCEKCVDDAEKIANLEADLAEARAKLAATEAKLETATTLIEEALKLLPWERNNFDGRARAWLKERT